MDNTITAADHARVLSERRASDAAGWDDLTPDERVYARARRPVQADVFSQRAAWGAAIGAAAGLAGSVLAAAGHAVMPGLAGLLEAGLLPALVGGTVIGATFGTMLGGLAGLLSDEERARSLPVSREVYGALVPARVAVRRKGR